MRKLKFKKDFKFKMTIVVISLLIFIGLLSSHFTESNFYFISTIIGFLSLIAIIVAAIGFLKALKKFKKPYSTKSIVPILLTSLLMCLLLYLIIENIMDAIKHIN